MTPTKKNRSKRAWGAMLFSVLIPTLFWCTSNDVTGTIDETDTGIAAMIYNPDLTPAAGVTVKIFTVDDTTKTPVFELLTDSTGRFATTELANGRYNMYAANDSMVAFQDSITVSKGIITISTDTLETPRTLSGIIGLQPNHDPRTSTVQVVGTDIYSNVDEAGYFTLHNMAKGEFTLKLATTLENYTTTFKGITIRSASKDTIADTLWLIYTGIPVVEGVTATYDTLHGVVTLSWNATQYRDFQDYLIYRDYFDSLNLSTAPRYSTNSTIFQDTIFNTSLPAGAFSAADTNNYHFKYRVAIRNNSQEIGLSYKFTEVVAASPHKIKPAITASFYHLQKGLTTDSGSVNDSILCKITVSNRNRQVTGIDIHDLQNDSLLLSKTFDPTNSYQDSIILTWDATGEKKLLISVKDESGTVSKESTTFFVVQDNPKTHITTTHLTFNSTTKIQAEVSDTYGEVVLCEWRFGDDPNYVRTTSVPPETTITTGDSLIEPLTCVLRVTDDDGNVSYDSTNLQLNMEWDKIALPADMKSMTYGITLADKAFVFTFGNTPNVWMSENGTDWSISASPAWTDRVVQPMVCNNEMWVLEPSRATTIISKLWHSKDGADWSYIDVSDQILLGGLYSRTLFASFNDSLYIGSTSPDPNDTAQGTFFSSSVNGIEWNTIQSPINIDAITPSDNYSIAEFKQQLFFGVSETLWGTVKRMSDWKSIEKVHTFTPSEIVLGNTITPYVFNAYNKLCIFLNGSGNEYSGKMLFLNDERTFSPCSDTPTSAVECAMEFKNQLYIASADEMWVSK